MKWPRILTVLGVALSATTSALAIPTLVIQDGSGINAISTSPSGIVSLTTADSLWTVVITTGISSPPIGGGTASFPNLDLAITATSANGSQNNPLRIYFASDGFGPSIAFAAGRQTGHLISGTAAGVSYNTYYNVANAVSSLGSPIPGGSTLLTSSGNLLGPDYASSQTSSSFALAAPYSLIEFVTIDGGVVGGSYSLDANLALVPEPSTLGLAGVALVGWAFATARRRR